MKTKDIYSEMGELLGRAMKRRLREDAIAAYSKASKEFKCNVSLEECIEQVTKVNSPTFIYFDEKGNVKVESMGAWQKS